MPDETLSVSPCFLSEIFGSAKVGCGCTPQVQTLCSSGTGALVGVDEVDAGSSILTGLRLTLVYLLGAVYTMIAGNTLTEGEKIIIGLIYPILIFTSTSFHFKTTHLTTVSAKIIRTDGSILTGIG